MCVPLSLVIPAYNEGGRLADTLCSWARFLADRPEWTGSEIIVVCDGCTDDTADVARRSVGDSVQLTVVSYSPNRGKGFALRQGVAASRGGLVLMADADGTTPLSEAVWMAELLQQRQADIVVGSRRSRATELAAPQPWHRRALGRVFSRFARGVLGLPIVDTQCGFKLFDGSVARWLFSSCRCDHFAIDLELLYRARLTGLRAVEAGIVWRNGAGSRVHSLRDGLRMVRDALAIRFGKVGKAPPLPPVVPMRPARRTAAQGVRI